MQCVVISITGGCLYLLVKTIQAILYAIRHLPREVEHHFDVQPPSYQLLIVKVKPAAELINGRIMIPYQLLIVKVKQL